MSNDKTGHEAMMRLAEAAAAVAGELAGQDREFFAVSTDSRRIHPGDLFIALKGAHFDGASFAGKALAAGAAGVMVNRTAEVNAAPAIHVDDTRLALGRLAAYWRGRFLIPVIAITGSNGKTTVKEMSAAILRKASRPEGVLATEGNLNNDIGCPLMLLRLRGSHAYAVLEMGMNHPGEIRYLSRLARPDVALVNNAQSAHIGHLGSVRAIAEAKGEIFEGLCETGTAIINADDPHAGYWRGLNRGRRIVSFGFAPDADVRGAYQPGEFGGTLEVASPQGSASIALKVPGNTTRAMRSPRSPPPWRSVSISPPPPPRSPPSPASRAGSSASRPCTAGCSSTTPTTPTPIPPVPRLPCSRASPDTNASCLATWANWAKKVQPCMRRSAWLRARPGWSACSGWANLRARRSAPSAPAASITNASRNCWPMWKTHWRRV